MNVLDLFSGIGGFSLGLERAGMRTIAFCEVEPYCREVLKQHWPDVPILGDIRSTGFDCIEADVICGGFPCQDISLAGKGAGITGSRSGLWSEYARAIGEVRPRYVIVENVAALLGRGIERVLGDLAALGYDAEWHCIPASAIGAFHRRDRLWIVAHAASERRGETRPDSKRHSERPSSRGNALANADSVGLPKRPTLGGRLAKEIGRFARLATERCDCSLPNANCEPQEWPTESWCERCLWSFEPDVGRMANGVSFRVDRLKALGNSIVPQIAEIIGRSIMSTQAFEMTVSYSRESTVNAGSPLNKLRIGPTMTKAEQGAWAIWHPTKGFGHYINVNTEIDDAKADLDARRILEEDDQWKIVPVLVCRVDHT